jgi:hypothetical protein
MGMTRIRPARGLEPPWLLRIELLDVRPLVWRRLLLPANTNLPRLHRVFQAALGWTNSHLHEFVINGVRYAEPDPDLAGELKQVDERRVVLSKAFGMDTRCFDHLVVVEDRHPDMASAAAEVFCTGGENACPPEDVGGPPGYANFLVAISDPRHEEHQNYMEWSGGHFDSVRFDQAAVNRALERIADSG